MENNTSHFGLWNYARTFHNAAEELRESEEILSEAPVYYLYGHAIEIAFKSFLLFKEYSERDLKNIGHDLEKVMNKAVEQGLDKQLVGITNLKPIIDLINPYYKGKEFEYIKNGGKLYPLISDLNKVSTKIIYAVGQNIGIPKSQLNKMHQDILKQSS